MIKPARRKRRLFYGIFILIFFASCSQKFDKEGWKQKYDMEYPNRDHMLEDLIHHHKLVGLKYHELIDLLGQPDSEYNDSMKITYEIETKYDVIDPDYFKALIFNINKDSVIISYRVYEWKK